jgi:hypothetical protein
VSDLRDYPIEHQSLVFDKGQQITTRRASIQNPGNSIVTVAFVPTQVCETPAIGIQFRCFQRANLFARFCDHPLTFRVHPPEPNLTVTVCSFKSAIFIGETSLIELHVKMVQWH